MSGAFPDGTTIDAVVATLERMAFADHDGVRFFHQVYTRVTREVAGMVQAGAFEDRRFLVELDVVFAGLYVSAVRDPDAAPRAWRVLFERRTQRIDPLRFALAGMNAHINRDLAVALDATYAKLGGDPERDSARCRDYLKINELLAARLDDEKLELLSPLGERIDARLGEVDDLLEIWSIRAARDTAWTHGAILHKLRSFVIAEVREAQMRSIDRTASLIGRLLLL